MARHPTAPEPPRRWPRILSAAALALALAACASPGEQPRAETSSLVAMNAQIHRDWSAQAANAKRRILAPEPLPGQAQAAIEAPAAPVLRTAMAAAP